MKNKSGIIIDTFIEKLKKNTHYFGNLACVQMVGTHFVAADIAMDSGSDKPEVYRVIVIKHAND